jgi:hypothetical protein
MHAGPHRLSVSPDRFFIKFYGSARLPDSHEEFLLVPTHYLKYFPALFMTNAFVSPFEAYDAICQSSDATITPLHNDHFQTIVIVRSHLQSSNRGPCTLPSVNQFLR